MKSNNILRKSLAAGGCDPLPYFRSNPSARKYRLRPKPQPGHLPTKSRLRAVKSSTSKEIPSSSRWPMAVSVTFPMFLIAQQSPWTASSLAFTTLSRE